MRRVNSYVESLGSPIATKQFVNNGEFPNSIPIWDNSSLMGVRLMVDPVLGDDSNDGCSWETPFKSIQAAVDALPDDLHGRHAVILLHPGDYLLTNTLNINKTNGVFYLAWCGTFLNESSGNTDIKRYYAWARNGVANPIRNNDPVRIKFDPSVTHVWTLMKIINIGADNSFSLILGSRDFNYEVNEVGFAYWDKFIFEGYSGRTPSDYSALIYSNYIIFNSNDPITFDLKNARLAWNFDWCKGWFLSFKIIGGTGEVSSSTSGWRGMFNFAPLCEFEIKYSTCSFAAGFEPPFKNQEIYDFTGNLFAANPLSNGSKVYATGLKSTYVHIDNSGISQPDKCNLYLGNYAMDGSEIDYDNSLFTFVDQCINKHIIKEYDAGLSLVSNKSYMNGDLYIEDGNFVFAGGLIPTLPTSDPLVAGALWNDSGSVKISAG